MNKCKILLVTDSRGRGIAEYLQNQQLDCEINTKILSGADLNRLLETIYKQFDDYDFYFVCGGICSFTVRKTINENSVLCYEPDLEITGRITTLIHSYYEVFGQKLQLATIPPAHLENYNIWHNGTLQEYGYNVDEQQELLYNHLDEVNQHIIAENIALDLETLNWSEKTFSRAVKDNRRVIRFKRSRFSDGVHPDTPLREKLFTRVADIIRNILKRRQNFKFDREKSQEDPLPCCSKEVDEDKSLEPKAIDWDEYLVLDTVDEDLEGANASLDTHANQEVEVEKESYLNFLDSSLDSSFEKTIELSTGDTSDTEYESWNYKRRRIHIEGRSDI